jgi:hypothetical protein
MLNSCSRYGIYLVAQTTIFSSFPPGFARESAKPFFFAENEEAISVDRPLI